MPRARFERFLKAEIKLTKSAGIGMEGIADILYEVVVNVRRLGEVREVR